MLVNKRYKPNTVLMFTFTVIFCISSCSKNPQSLMNKNENQYALQQLDLLNKESQKIESINQIKRLQRAYGYYLDAGQWDAVADLFIDNGNIELAHDGVFKGRERIREYLYHRAGGKLGLREGELNEHVQLQPIIHLSKNGQSAKGRWRDFGMLSYGKGHAAWTEGPYENTYVKEDGLWKIASVHWYEGFTVNYEGGWGLSDNIASNYSMDNFPADAPSTEAYKSWPDVYLPPFHYTDPTLVGSATDLDINAFDNIVDPELKNNLQGQAQRLQKLIDTAAIENLISAYGYYLDDGQWDDVVTLFAENGSAEIAQRGVYSGHKSIRRMMNLFGEPGIKHGVVHHHIQVQPVIHIDGAKAFVRARAISQIGYHKKVAIWGDGVYEHELVKVNGVWKFQKDHIYTTFFSLYDKGFAAGARPAPTASEDNPPDAPPSEEYQSFPSVYLPPFHYPHPITGQAVQNSTLKISAKVSDENNQTSSYKGPLANQVEQLNKRITHQQDIRDIEALQRTYGFYVDKALWRETADLFAEGGTLEIGGRGIFVGKERIYEYFNFLGPEGLLEGRLINHLQLQPLVTIDDNGTTARARARFLAEGGDERSAEKLESESPGVKHSSYLGTGIYENEYVKENGIWKIKKLYAAFRMYTLDVDGWGKSPLPMTRPEDKLPPDLPPTVNYDMYPATYIAPYHFNHPVTGQSIQSNN